MNCSISFILIQERSDGGHIDAIGNETSSHSETALCTQIAFIAEIYREYIHWEYLTKYKEYSKRFSFIFSDLTLIS